MSSYKSLVQRIISDPTSVPQNSSTELFQRTGSAVIHDGHDFTFVPGRPGRKRFGDDARVRLRKILDESNRWQLLLMHSLCPSISSYLQAPRPSPHVLPAPFSLLPQNEFIVVNIHRTGDNDNQHYMSPSPHFQTKTSVVIEPLLLSRSPYPLLLPRQVAPPVSKGMRGKWSSH